MGILEQCEKYFGTRDIYQLFGVAKDADERAIKKAYYKISLLVHPDRVPETEKTEATEKFKILSNLYQVVSDKDKRAIYDEHGTVDDEEDYESKLGSWLELWRRLFKPITTEDIINYEKSYINSQLERSDIRKWYLQGKGCINVLLDEVPFMKVEDEPRLQKIVKEMIAAGEVPEYKIFTNEPAAKRKRRHEKYKRQSQLASKAAAQRDEMMSLQESIQNRRNARQSDFTSMIDRLAKTYGCTDDNDVEIITLKAKTTKKSKQKAQKNRKRNDNSKEEEPASLRRVKSGRVSKKP